MDALRRPSAFGMAPFPAKKRVDHTEGWLAKLPGRSVLDRWLSFQTLRKHEFLGGLEKTKNNQAGVFPGLAV